MIESNFKMTVGTVTVSASDDNNGVVLVSVEAFSPVKILHRPSGVGNEEMLAIIRKSRANRVD